MSLTTLGEDNAELRMSLTTLGEDNAELRESLTTLGEDNAELRESLTTLEEDNAELQTSLTTLEGDSATQRMTIEAIEEELNTLRTTYKAVEEEKIRIEIHASTIESDRERLKAELAQLEALNGTLQELEDQIRELSQRREALILAPGDTSRTGFACTGSMEPKITCLDEATWLHDFDPKDIVVGTTISFDPGCGGSEPTGVGISHRVMNIKFENGSFYFWPRGDNNLTDDGCWIHESRVRSYLIEIHKNVRPQNAELRRNVNAATVAYRAAGQALNDALSEMERLRVESERLLNAHNANPSPESYAEWKVASDAWRSAYARWEELRADFEPVHAAYICWLDYARSPRGVASC